jgi:predicted DNA-binding ribbon-helix-helix protein
MNSPVVKRSIIIAGHKTSVSLEDAFWQGLKEIANARELTLSDTVAAIDTDRRHGNLSSAIRLFVLEYFRTKVAEQRKVQSASRGGPGARPTSSIVRAD